MTNLFKKKALTPSKRICLRLKEQRLKKGVGLVKLASRTRISKKHLIALEKCQFDKLPEGEIYQKNFIKRYLQAIEIDPEPFLDQFTKEEISFSKSNQKKHPRQYLALSRFSNLPSLLRFLAALLIISLFVIYLGLQVKNILEPPQLALFSPQNGYVSDEGSVRVQGETEKGATLSINGKGIAINENGQFEETVDLSPGLNTIVITAEKKHGQQTVETRHVVLKESQ